MRFLKMSEISKNIKYFGDNCGGDLDGYYIATPAIQWLTAYDGVTPFVDRKDEVTSPVATDVNCFKSVKVSSAVAVPDDPVYLTSDSIVRGKFKWDADTFSYLWGCGSQFGMSASTSAHIGFRYNGQTIASASAPLAGWNTFEVSKDGFYLNGTLEGTPTADTFTCTNRLVIGARSDDDGASYASIANCKFDYIEVAGEGKWVGSSHDKPILYDVARLSDYEARFPLQYLTMHPYTSDLSPMVVHPGVWVFDEPWNGWKYWMIYTPYPDALSGYENPSIEVSNDGVNWQVPAGLTNPISPKPPTDAGFNSDPEIFFDDLTQTLRVIFRTSGESAESDRDIFEQYTSDGINWSVKTSILHTVSSTENFVSPTTVWDGSNWQVWTADFADSQAISRRTRATVNDSLGSKTACTLTGIGADQVWHFQVKLVDGEYLMLAQTGDSGGGELWLVRSDDGLVWDFTNKEVILETIRGVDMYRSAFWPIMEDGKRKFKMWAGSNEEWLFYYGIIEQQANNATVDNWTLAARATDDELAPSRNLEYGFTKGLNMISGGDPIDPTYWVLESGWSIVGNSLVVEDLVSGDYARHEVRGTLVNAQTYRLEFNCTRTTAGNLRLSASGFAGSQELGDLDGAQSHIITCTDATLPLAFTTVGWEGSISDIRLYDITEESYIVPAADGTTSLDSDGNPITNKGGYVHNGAECSIKQTATTPFGDGGTNFWSATNPTLDEKTKAQLDTHFNNTNGSYNLWLKYLGDNTYESVQYPLDKEFTPGEVVKNENYFGGTSGALRDVDGEFILDVDGYVIFTA